MLVTSPRPTPRHQRCIRELESQLLPQLPDGLESFVDVDLELVAPDEPGFVRAPDLVVVTGEAYERVDRKGGLLRAADVVLGVEVISPGSQRRDRTVKRAEYADAGIPHYWIVDIHNRVTLTACHLAGEFGHADAGPITGTFTTDTPFPVRLELDQLIQR